MDDFFKSQRTNIAVIAFALMVVGIWTIGQGTKAKLDIGNDDKTEFHPLEADFVGMTSNETDLSIDGSVSGASAITSLFANQSELCAIDQSAGPLHSEGTASSKRSPEAAASVYLPIDFDLFLHNQIRTPFPLTLSGCYNDYGLERQTAMKQAR